MGTCCNSSTVITDKGFNIHKQKALELFDGVEMNESLKIDIHEKINNMEIEYLFGGGFYEFQLKDDELGITEMKVSLILKSIDNYQHLNILRQLYEIKGPLNDKLGENNLPSATKTEHVVQFSEVADSLNGIGRIEYVDVEEKRTVDLGMFENGVLMGGKR